MPMALTTASFFGVFLVGALVHAKAYERKREQPLLSSVVFWGVGAVACICQPHKLLAQTTPTALFE